MLNILMASSEVLPFSKTGGLADVAYSLSKEYVNEADISIITPFYSFIKKEKYRGIERILSLNIKINNETEPCDIYEVRYNKITYYLVQNEKYFGRDNIYGYKDDDERFAYFALAIIQFLKEYNVYDIVHLNDWQTAIVACLLKTKHANDNKLKKIKSVLTIHNPLFKGYLPYKDAYSFFNIDNKIVKKKAVGLHKKFCTLKAGVYYADKITTVSKTHAKELFTKKLSFGLNKVLIKRKKDFVGIVNGMDYGEFNPTSDKLIYKTFSADQINNKFLNKLAFCREFNLKSELPLYAVISRLTSQKGLDLMYGMVKHILDNGGNFAVVGTGEEEPEEFFKSLKEQYPNNVFIYIGYSDNLAHKLYAASDFFLMPSKLEPCGIGQMIAHRYGSLPIVRETGGLKDTVIGLKDDNVSIANGFTFKKYKVSEAIETVQDSLELYKNNENLRQLSINAMMVDHSWARSSKKYLNLYKQIINKL